MPLHNLCVVPCAWWLLWGQVFPPFPHWDCCLSVQALACLVLAASESRTKARLPFPAIFVRVHSCCCWRWAWPKCWAVELSLINWVRLCHNHFNRQNIQQVILLAIVPFFRGVKRDLMLGLTYNIFVPVFLSRCCFTAECCRLILSDGATSYCLKNV